MIIVVAHAGSPQRPTQALAVNTTRWVTYLDHYSLNLATSRMTSYNLGLIFPNANGSSFKLVKMALGYYLPNEFTPAVFLSPSHYKSNAGTTRSSAVVCKLCERLPRVVSVMTDGSLVTVFGKSAWLSRPWILHKVHAQMQNNWYFGVLLVALIAMIDF